MPAVNIMIFNEFRLFPMISNDFQSIPITFEKTMKPGDLRCAIDDLRTAWWRGIKGMAGPQGAGCAGRQGRSATCPPLAGQSESNRDRVLVDWRHGKILENKGYQG